MTGAAGRPARPIKKNAPYGEFAEQLRALRNGAGLKMRELAKKTKYSTGSLSRAESGAVLPSRALVRAFASACGADPQAWEARWREAANRAGTVPPQNTAPPRAGIAVAVVDDYPDFPELVSRLLESAGSNIRVIGTAATVSELLVGSGRRADVVLLDLSLGDGTTVEDNIAAVRAAGPAVLAFSASDDSRSVQVAMRAGALGYLVKGGPSAEIVFAVEEVAAGREWTSPRLGYTGAAERVGADTDPAARHDQMQAKLIADLRAAPDLEEPKTRVPPPAVVSRAWNNAAGVAGQVTAMIIEDHPVVTEGVASWIRSDPGQRVQLVQTARDLSSLDAGAGPRPAADVVILDLELSGELVIPQIPALVAAGYRVVVFSGHSSPEIVMECLDNGVHAYVSKEEGRDHLVEAVVAAAADRPYVTRSQARAFLADERPARPVLSQQEQQALLLWFQGMSKASVGRRMALSENTVRQYISRARAKYAATGRAAASKDALLARAIEDGVIKPSEITSYTSYASTVTDRPSLGAPRR